MRGVSRLAVSGRWEAPPDVQTCCPQPVSTERCFSSVHTRVTRGYTARRASKAVAAAVLKSTVLMSNSCSPSAADAGEDPANASGRRSGRRCGGRRQVQLLSANAGTGLARRDDRSLSGTGAQRSWQVGPRGSPCAVARHTRRGARAICDLHSGSFRTELAQLFLRCWGDVSASRRAPPAAARLVRSCRRRFSCYRPHVPPLPFRASPTRPRRRRRGLLRAVAGAAPASSCSLAVTKSAVDPPVATGELGRVGCAGRGGVTSRAGPRSTTG